MDLLTLSRARITVSSRGRTLLTNSWFSVGEYSAPTPPRWASHAPHLHFPLLHCDIRHGEAVTTASAPPPHSRALSEGTGWAGHSPHLNLNLWHFNSKLGYLAPKRLRTSTSFYDIRHNGVTMVSISSP
ncbi:hypothetical protein J6590_056422 [Homalodisca vitripennis]|nr:hypothetical protein J6590_056422 [Homalodisca vitripennis]